MERKHFLTLGAGLTVGGLIGKSALNGEKISGAKTKISDFKFDLEKPFPISPEGDVNHPEQDGPPYHVLNYCLTPVLPMYLLFLDPLCLVSVS